MTQPDGRLAMVDIQDAQWGPDSYDLASLLYSPDSRLDESGRDRLISVYLDALAQLGQSPEREEFLRDIRLTIARWNQKLNLLDSITAELIYKLEAAVQPATAPLEKRA